MPEIELSQGTIRYRDQGTGPTVVLVHGLLVNATVWDRLLPALSRSARCVVPDLPLGSHPIPMRPGADLTPSGQARLIAEFLERLDLSDVTLVGNDTGGALCQLVCAERPGRVGRLVLINCDAFEHFPPPAFKGVVKVGARVPGAILCLALLSRLRAVRRRAMASAPLTVDAVPDELVAGWVAPLRDRRIRRDLVKAMRGINPELTLAAAEALRAFDRPALIVWGLRDKFFPLSDAERLVATLPHARLEQIPNARTFVQLDDPERLAGLIGSFIAEPAAGAAAA